MKTKRFLLTLVLFTSTLFIKAQDKYQHMTIIFVPALKNEIQISIDGKEYIEEKADYSPGEKASFNTNPLLKKIAEYEAKGWELLSYQAMPPTTGSVAAYHSFLRKKKVD